MNAGLIRSPLHWAVPAIGLALALLFGLLPELNRSAFLEVNGWNSFTGTALWAHITIFGDAIVVFALVLPFVGRRPEVLWSIVLTAIIAAIVVQGLKFGIGAARPPQVLAPDQLNVTGFIAQTLSFPSGHTASAFALVGVLGLKLLRPGTTVFLVVAAGLVGLSRMVVGAHWPVDVAAGAAIGWLAALAGVWLSERLPGGLARRPQLVMAGLLGLAVINGAVSHDGGYPGTRPMLVTVLVLALVLAVPGAWRLWRGHAPGTRTVAASDSEL